MLGFLRDFISAQKHVDKESRKYIFSFVVETYVAIAKANGDRVAIKKINKNKLKYAQILQALTGQENVVKFLNAYEDDSFIYIVMELYEGVELSPVGPDFVQSRLSKVLINFDSFQFLQTKLEKDMTISREMWYRIDEVLPLVAMLIITCLDVSLLVVVKAAMNGGMESIVYVVYHNVLATLILLPFFILHIFRKRGRPSLTFTILFRFFILGLLGICLCEVLAYLGVNYSSPTMASGIGNLSPGITFLVAVVFRMERIDMKSSSSGAKLLGTIIALSGSMVLTFYQGPIIFHTIPSLGLPNQQLPSLEPSNWVLGGVIIFLAVLCSCLWNVLQTTTDREHPDQQTIVFFMCLFGTIQCIALSPFIEPSPSAWVVHHKIGMIAIVFGAVHSTVFRCTIVIWCLRKKGPVFVAMFSPLSIVISIIMGVVFLGDSLYLGSAIGAAIVTSGFYTVMWGQTIQEDKLHEDLGVEDELGSSDQTIPLLSSRNEFKC